jgi:hypothetical protein
MSRLSVNFGLDSASVATSVGSAATGASATMTLAPEGFVALYGFVGLSAPAALTDEEPAAVRDAIRASAAQDAMLQAPLDALREGGGLTVSPAAAAVLVAEVVTSAVDLGAIDASAAASSASASSSGEVLCSPEDVQDAQALIDEYAGGSRYLTFDLPADTFPAAETAGALSVLRRFADIVGVDGAPPDVSPWLAALQGQTLNRWHIFARQRAAHFAVDLRRKLVLRVPFTVLRQAWLHLASGSRMSARLPPSNPGSIQPPTLLVPALMLGSLERVKTATATLGPSAVVHMPTDVVASLRMALGALTKATTVGLEKDEDNAGAVSIDLDVDSDRWAEDDAVATAIVVSAVVNWTGDVVTVVEGEVARALQAVRNALTASTSTTIDEKARGNNTDDLAAVSAGTSEAPAAAMRSAPPSRSVSAGALRYVHSASARWEATESVLLASCAAVAHSSPAVQCAAMALGDLVLGSGPEAADFHAFASPASVDSPSLLRATLASGFGLQKLSASVVELANSVGGSTTPSREMESAVFWLAVAARLATAGATVSLETCTAIASSPTFVAAVQAFLVSSRAFRPNPDVRDAGDLLASLNAACMPVSAADSGSAPVPAPSQPLRLRLRQRPDTQPTHGTLAAFRHAMGNVDCSDVGERDAVGNGVLACLMAHFAVRAAGTSSAQPLSWPSDVPDEVPHATAIAAATPSPLLVAMLRAAYGGSMASVTGNGDAAVALGAFDAAVALGRNLAGRWSCHAMVAASVLG